MPLLKREVGRRNVETLLVGSIGVGDVDDSYVASRKIATCLNVGNCRFYTVAIQVGNTTTAVNLGECRYVTHLGVIV